MTKELHKTLAAQVYDLEKCGGNLRKWLALGYPAGTSDEIRLFLVETELAKPENAELKKRWQDAINMSAGIRMNLLKCKALSILEDYQNLSDKSSSSDISFAKAVLVGELAAITPASNEQQQATKEDDVMTELEGDFDKAEVV